MDKGLKEINRRTITYKVFRFDFDNELAYIEQRKNARLVDCYFAEKDGLWPDGSIKPGYNKYFFCSNPDNVQKIVKPIDCLNFDFFNHLYYFDDNGKIFRVDGKEMVDSDEF